MNVIFFFNAFLNNFCCSYERVDELIWVKTNQLQRLIRTGRTGHWINHGKEHCLVSVLTIVLINLFTLIKIQIESCVKGMITRERLILLPDIDTF